MQKQSVYTQYQNSVIQLDKYICLFKCYISSFEVHRSLLCNMVYIFFNVSGTTERVCLITGNVDAIITVLGFVMEKIKEKPDPNAKADYDGKNSADREKQVSIFFVKEDSNV